MDFLYQLHVYATWSWAAWTWKNDPKNRLFKHFMKHCIHRINWVPITQGGCASQQQAAVSLWLLLNIWWENGSSPGQVEYSMHTQAHTHPHTQQVEEFLCRSPALYQSDAREGDSICCRTPNGCLFFITDLQIIGTQTHNYTLWYDLFTLVARLRKKGKLRKKSRSKMSGYGGVICSLARLFIFILRLDKTSISW